MYLALHVPQLTRKERYKARETQMRPFEEGLHLQERQHQFPRTSIRMRSTVAAVAAASSKQQQQQQAVAAVMYITHQHLARKLFRERPKH
jgi:hypothetical protein